MLLVILKSTWSAVLLQASGHTTCSPSSRFWLLLVLSRTGKKTPVCMCVRKRDKERDREREKALVKKRTLSVN